jgi:flavoprotein
MNKPILITAILILTTIGATTYYTAGRKCTGSKDCNACKNCKYCKHCAKNGGSLGCVNKQINAYINKIDINNTRKVYIIYDINYLAVKHSTRIS